MRFLLFSWLLLLHFLSIFFGIYSVSVNGQCLEHQRSLLIKLNQSLSFASASPKLTSWDSSSDCCSWEGVFCDKEAGHVIGLDLSNQSISGGIGNSSSLFNLRYLQSLNLAHNNFNSIGIPFGFERLFNLTNLNLSNSGFAGQIPIEIARLKRLVSLDLSTFSFGLTVLKLESPDLGTLVQNLSGLTTLRLDGVNISARGSEWCKSLASVLPSLQVLSLSNCYLSGPFDSSLVKLQSLYELRLDQNNISAEVPEFFGNFSNLAILHLSSCGLNGNFPKKIFQSTALRILDLSINPHLHGSLPEFPQNGSLQNLVLSNTNFSGPLPNSIGNLRFLSKLILTGCAFNGSIPHSIEDLTQLLILDFSSNRFTGPIPSFGLSENLTQINLAHNQLRGPISSFQWDRLQKLENLDLRNNSLTGNIPLPLFTLPSLRKLQLALNQLIGQLSEFSNASSLLLDTLDLSSNKLEGSIPMSIFELQGLKILTLSSNKFNGTVQLDSIQKLGNLSSLDLSHNRLFFNTSVNSNSFSFPKISTLKLASCKLGVFPDFLRINQTSLSFLDLSGNQIPGKIPNWIWNIDNGALIYLNLSFNHLEDLEKPLPNLSSSSLAILDLHSNLLKGPLPILPPFASYLDYSNNNFTSGIPANIDSYLLFTIFFSLSGNKLSGEIPRSICNVSYLQVLDLSNNSLSGLIPPCLGNMSTTLGVLNLGGNNFQGVMPQPFPQGCTLRTLNLNSNMLEGQVSRTLANCTMLEVLELGNNQIRDTFPCWLGNLPHLRVLVLRSNKFYGPIKSPGTNCTFSMLQIIDLSSNDFRGKLPSECFSSWREMMVSEDEAQSKHKHGILRYGGFLELTQLYYQDTVTVTSKGLEMELVKILTIFTSIDFSNNRFVGEIPEVMGNLISLYVLNLSSNGLTGQIPSSLGQLKQLESLDLSQNKLSGMIPMQLGSLTFLSVLNFSWNNLVGMIPLGNQFQTFTNASFEGNVGLCGLPLSRNCTEASSPTSTIEHQDSKSLAEFDWKFILPGVGYGVGAGVVVGTLVFWKKGKKWYDEHIDRVLFMIIPSAGLLYTNCGDGRVEAEENMKELTEMSGDYDDDDEEMKDQENCHGRFCVFCSKLDISRRKIVHNPYCSCHEMSPPNFSSSL